MVGGWPGEPLGCARRQFRRPGALVVHHRFKKTLVRRGDLPLALLDQLGGLLVRSRVALKAAEGQP